MFKKIILTASLFFIPVISFASTYGSNFLTGGTCSDISHISTYVCGNAVDGNTATYWASNGYQLTYDLGVGVTKAIAKIYFDPYADVDGQGLQDWSVSGSNDSSTWTTIFATTTQSNTTTNHTYVNATTTPSSNFRYYRVDFSPSYRSGQEVVINEVGMYECTDCGTGTSTATSSIIGFMSPQLDFMLQLFIEALFVIMGLVAGYLVLKRLTKK